MKLSETALADQKSFLARSFEMDSFRAAAVWSVFCVLNSYFVLGNELSYQDRTLAVGEVTFKKIQTTPIVSRNSMKIFNWRNSWAIIIFANLPLYWKDYNLKFDKWFLNLEKKEEFLSQSIIYGFSQLVIRCAFVKIKS